MEETLEEEIRKKTAKELSEELDVGINSDHVRDILAAYSKALERAEKRLCKDLNLSASLYQKVRDKFDPLLTDYLFVRNMGVDYNLGPEKFKKDLEKAVAEKEKNFLSTDLDYRGFPKKMVVKLHEIGDQEVQIGKVLDLFSKQALKQCSPEVLKRSVKELRFFMDGFLRKQVIDNVYESVEKEKREMTPKKLDSIIKEIKQKHETALNSRKYADNRKKLEGDLKELEHIRNLDKGRGKLAKVVREIGTIRDKAFEGFYKKLETMKVFGAFMERLGVPEKEERKGYAGDLLERTIELMGLHHEEHFEKIRKKVPGREAAYHI